MTEVYFDERLDRNVAEILPAYFVADESQLRRFRSKPAPLRRTPTHHTITTWASSKAFDSSPLNTLTAATCAGVAAAEDQTIDEVIDLMTRAVGWRRVRPASSPRRET